MYGSSMANSISVLKHCGGSIMLWVTFEQWGEGDWSDLRMNEAKYRGVIKVSMTSDFGISAWQRAKAYSQDNAGFGTSL